MRSFSFLLPSLAGGGAERVCLDVSRELIRLGHTVHFVLMRASGEFLQEAEALGISVFDLNATRVRHVPFTLMRYFIRERPQIFIASLWPLSVVGAITIRVARMILFRKCQVLLCEHNTLSAQYSKRGRFFASALRVSLVIGCRMADFVIGVSAGVVRDVASLARLKVERCHVVHNPVRKFPPVTLGKIAAAEAYWANAGTKPTGSRIISVGKLKAQKNHSLLLRAFARLPLTSARLMIVGQGELELRLREEAKELGVSDRVIFAGFQSDPSPFYATADLFVLSSDYEGFANVIAEAMSLGLPIISTDCESGPSEILQDGRFGRLVPVGNVSALSDAMMDELSSRSDGGALKQRAEEFSSERAAAKYLNIVGS